jgi:hypothetical protein
MIMIMEIGSDCGSIHGYLGVERREEREVEKGY